MTLTRATFHYIDKKTKIKVSFLYDEKGQGIAVWVTIGVKVFKIDNPKGTWKPCATHAKELIRSCQDKPEKNEFAKQRAQRSAKQAKSAKPELKVIG